MVSNTSSRASFFVAMTMFVNWKICEAGLRIIGGRNTLQEEFPFAIRLEYQYPTFINNTKFYEYLGFCTGAAIAPSWILTAAHCDDDNVFKLMKIYLTEKPKKIARYNSYFPKELGRLSPITKVIGHPNFVPNIFGNQRLQYDIALYQTENITISSYGKISAIDYAGTTGHEVWLIGFGITNASMLETPLQVLKGMLMKCDANLCKGFPNVLCVVPRCDLEATLCSGDSGGPVLHATGIVGVNSMSSTKCQNLNYRLVHPGRPAGYISMVGPLVDWITYITGNETDGRQ